MNELTQRILKNVEKQYGKNILTDSVDIVNRKTRIIPFSPRLDILLGGGVPEGSWMTLAGKPKSGKSSSALDFAATCQRPEYGEKTVYYFNVEGRLKPMNLNGICGLNLDKIHVVQSTKEYVLTLQDHLEIAKDVIYEHPECVVIIDSISALCADEEMVGNIGTFLRGKDKQYISQFIRKTCQVVPINRTIVIGIAHLIANTSGYGSPFVEKSGSAVQFQADIRLTVKDFKPWKDGDKTIGQTINWLVGSTALGAPPGETIESYFRYGYGLDKLHENILIAEEIGVIQKPAKSSWYSFGEEKFQGIHKLRQYFEEHPEETIKLEEQIKNCMT